MSTQSTRVSATNNTQAANASMWHIELESDLLDEQGTWPDRLITFAFDKLGARHIDLRVVASCSPSPSPSAACGASSKRSASNGSLR